MPTARLRSCAVLTALGTIAALGAVSGGLPAAAAPAYTVQSLHFKVQVGPDRNKTCDIVGDLYKPAAASPTHRVPSILTTNGFGGSAAPAAKSLSTTPTSTARPGASSSASSAARAESASPTPRTPRRQRRSTSSCATKSTTPAKSERTTRGSACGVAPTAGRPMASRPPCRKRPSQLGPSPSRRSGSSTACSMPRTTPSDSLAAPTLPTSSARPSSRAGRRDTCSPVTWQRCGTPQSPAICHGSRSRSC